MTVENIGLVLFQIESSPHLYFRKKKKVEQMVTLGFFKLLEQAGQISSFNTYNHMEEKGFKTQKLAWLQLNLLKPPIYTMNRTQV